MEKVDSWQLFWASPGLYLRWSMLTSLAQNMFSCELPPHLLNGNTFENDEVSSSPTWQDDEIITCLPAWSYTTLHISTALLTVQRT